jgi:hypothetical protein
VLLFSSAAEARGGTQMIAAEDYELQLTADLRLSLDRYFLVVRSATAQALVSLPYGSSRRGWPDAIDHAALSASGDVVIYYRSECQQSLIAQATSLSVLRAKLLAATAELGAAADAESLLAQANALAPREPVPAVARAAIHGTEPSRAARLLAPALSVARFETYFEVLRQAPQLRELPLLAKQRAATAGSARLGFEAPLFALSGSLLALDVGAATEADCPGTVELLLLDLKTGAVVFRHPYVLYDDECRALPVHVSELNQLLSDFGFSPAGEAALAESTDYQQFSFAFEKAGVQLRVDRARHTLELEAGRAVRTVRRHWASAEAPQSAHLLSQLRTIVLQTNRDSDVCEGLPALELIRLPPR